MVEIYPDVSEHQEQALTSAYTRTFFMFRLASEYCRIDRYRDANLAESVRLRDAGRLVNFGGYVIPCVRSNAEVLGVVPAAFPRDAVVMIDLESWGGLVRGDHSDELTQLANALRTRQSGRDDLVWLYGNRGDLAALYPRRPSWLGVVLADYSASSKPDFPSLVAWQYKNAAENHSGLPSVSSPFPPCDHNALYIPVPSPAHEDDMTPEEHAMLAGIAGAIQTGGKPFPVGYSMQQQVLPFMGRTDASLNAVKALITGLPKANADAVAAAVVAALPTGGTGLTVADVELAVKTVLGQTHLETS